MGLSEPLYFVEQLQSVGVKRISVWGSFARAAFGAFIKAAQEVKEEGTFNYSIDAIPGSEIKRYIAKT